MPWNSPDGGNKDPWGKKPPQGPPDLDELLRKLHRKLRGVGGGGSSQSSTSPPGGIAALSGLVVVVALAVWFIAGLFIVPPAENAVILRFGKYQETVTPGLHWIPALIERKYAINVEKISTFSYQAEMLTGDENIVSVQIAVQYRIETIRDYLFNVINPQESLQQSTASALRQVIAGLNLNDILTAGGEQQAALSNQIADQLKSILAIYKTGLTITEVTLQAAKPPEAVVAAFDDAIMAREDAQRFINKAKAYQEGVEPVARGRATRIVQQAQAYKAQVINQARGDTARYLALLNVYKKAPEVTRERLYLSMLESVLSQNMKVLVDTKGNNNVLYLPLDRIIQQNQRLHSVMNDTTDNSREQTTTAQQDTSMVNYIRRERDQQNNGSQHDTYRGRDLS